MKRLTAIVSISVVILIPLLLFVTMCLPMNHSVMAAEDGMLDLSGTEMEDRVFALNGNWRYAHGVLIDPGAPYIDAGVIRVPSTWQDEGYPRIGASTYRLTVHVPDDGVPYMLMMNVVSSAYVLWVNGQRMYEAGVMSRDASTEYPLYSNTLVPVQADNGVLEIVMHVSNHHFYSGGITGIVFFGNADAVQRYFIRTRLISALALGCVLMTAFYHMQLYLFRRREKAYLLFALLCFLCFVRFLFETDGLNEFFLMVSDGMLGMRLYMALLALHSVAIVAFTLYVFDRAFLTKYRIPIAASFVVLGLIYWFMPINQMYSTMLATALLLVFVVFTIVKAALSPVLRKDPWTRLYFVSLFIYLGMGMTKLSSSLYLYMPGLASNLFMILVQSLLLSRSYAQAFDMVEETNQNLEKLVDERTISLQAANASMKASNAAMKELIANISHDLKTPLAVMSLNLETLLDNTVTQNDAGYQRYVRTAYQKNRDLQRLIQNLFEISRIETGRNLYSPVWQSLPHILAQARVRYDDFLEDRGITLDITMDDDADISTDPQKVWSVFDNIIYNAARYTESGGNITIAASGGAQSVTVTITDTGCGVSPEHLPHIFDRFYRASQARDAHEGETGLGLYIVKSIMDGCGGSVTARSEPGEGLTVVLVFPARLVAQNGSVSTLLPGM